MSSQWKVYKPSGNLLATFSGQHNQEVNLEARNFSANVPREQCSLD